MYGGSTNWRTLLKHLKTILAVSILVIYGHGSAVAFLCNAPEKLLHRSPGSMAAVQAGGNTQDIPTSSNGAH